MNFKAILSVKNQDRCASRTKNKDLIRLADKHLIIEMSLNLTRHKNNLLNRSNIVR